MGSLRRSTVSKYSCALCGIHSAAYLQLTWSFNWIMFKDGQNSMERRQWCGGSGYDLVEVVMIYGLSELIPSCMALYIPSDAWLTSTMQLIVYAVDFTELELYLVPVHLGSIVSLVHPPCALFQNLGTCCWYVTVKNSNYLTTNIPYSVLVNLDLCPTCPLFMANVFDRSSIWTIF